MSGRGIGDIFRARRSTRAFRPDPLPRRLVADILADARRAPSGANLQPGRFVALAGPALEDLKATLAEAIAEKRPQVAEYSYFPVPMPAHLKARQREAGYALYSALGIARRDVAGRREQFARNYAFFDAPVGIVVTIEREMGKGCYMDLGMALMGLLLAAEARGIASCGIGALASYGDLVHEALGIPGEELVVCGVALGLPDPDHPANTVRTSRLTLEEFAEFRGFPE